MQTPNEVSAPTSQQKPEGNTKTSGNYQRYRWCFTLPESEIKSEAKLARHLKKFCKEFYFQLEKGESSGYLHWQGCFSLERKESMNVVKNHFSQKIHLEPAINWFASMNYVSKDETRVKGPFNHNSQFIDTISEEEFYAWQKAAVEMIDKGYPFNKRIILWFWSMIGNNGKTELAKWLHIHRGATILQNSGTANLARAIDEENCNLVVFNVPRSSEERFNYGALESIKDGMIFSAKYESGIKLFNPPIVVVFANYEPEYSQLSKDRWMVINLDEATV